MKPWWYYRDRAVEGFQSWLMWCATGWPLKRRCGQCAGRGTYVSDASARYGDAAHKCDMCGGTGRVNRSRPWRRY